MSPEAVIVRHALTMFHAEDEECYLCSEFFDLGIKLRIAGNASAPLFNKATQDLWNISTLLARLEWTRTLAHQGALNTGAWSSFSSLDIENFFVQMRSIMDHVAEILQSLLPKGKQLPESFRRLRESLDKYRTRLPSDIAALVAGANWFDEMRSARDALVHQGGYSLVFSEPKDGILFQVYGKGHKGCFSHPAIMFNDNVVRFDRYASHVVSNLLVFLDRLGAALLSKTTAIGSVPGQVRCSSMGFALLRLWISDFLSVLHNAPSDRAPTP